MRVFHFVRIKEWLSGVNHLGYDVTYLHWFMLLFLLSWCLSSPHHTDGDVGDVSLRSIILSPTGIEVSGIYLYLVASEFVNDLLPMFHTVFVWP